MNLIQTHKLETINCGLLNFATINKINSLSNTKIMKNHALNIFILILIAGSVFAQTDPVDKKGLAIGGYDVVAYFKNNKPTKGVLDYSTVYKKVTYQFATTENKTIFLKTPEKFLPQYDGYCAYAIGKQSKKVSIDPETFIITGGKLYLFYNGTTGFSGNKFNSLEPWVADEKELINKSDVNWVKIKDLKKK